MTVLALLEPELAVIVGRLIRSGIPTNEAEGETLAAAWEVVTGRSKAKGPARLETIWTRARTATGLRRRCPVEVVPIPEGFDAADPKSDPPEGWPAVLAAAEAAGVLTPRQVAIVASTRVEGCSVAEVAKALGLAPKTRLQGPRPGRERVGGLRPLLRPLGVGTMTERVPDAGDVLGVELRGRLGHPALEGGAVPLGVEGPGADLPEPVVVGCASVARRGRPVDGVVVLGVEVVGGERERAGGDGHGDLADQALLVHPLEGVLGQPLEGLAADEGQRLGAQRDGRASADRVGFSGQALEGDPVTGHALDQVALPRRGLGEVLGPDAAPELVEVVAQRLGTDLGTLRADGAQADLDLPDPQVPPVVEDQVDQELFDDPAVAALEETEDLDGSHDVDGRDELARTPSSRPARRRGPARGPGGGGGASLGSRSTSVPFPMDSVAASAVAGVRWRTRCTTTTAAARMARIPTANPMGRPGPLPELEPVVLGAAEAPVAGKGAPTHGGFFWAGRELGTAGKLSVAVADAVS